MSMGRRQLFFWVAYALLAVFVIHAFDFSHDHPHAIFGTGTHAFLHGDHKKFLLLLLLATAICGVTISLLEVIQNTRRYMMFAETRPRDSFFDAIRVAMSDGAVARRTYA